MWATCRGCSKPFLSKEAILVTYEDVPTYRIEGAVMDPSNPNPTRLSIAYPMEGLCEEHPEVET